MLTKEEAQILRQERDPNFKPGVYPMSSIAGAMLGWAEVGSHVTVTL